MTKAQILSDLRGEEGQIEREIMRLAVRRATALAAGDTDAAQSHAATAESMTPRLDAVRKVIAAVAALKGDSLTVAKMVTVGDTVRKAE